MTRRHRWQARLEALEARNLLTQIADLDRDGDRDAYYQGNWYENTNGEGDFVRHVVSTNATLSALGDVDADGDGDLVTSPLGWYENNGQGDFTARTMPSVGISGVSRIKFTDVGNDGRMDVVVFGDTQLALLRNTDGRGTFSLELTTSAINVADAGDFDNDGDLDLLILELSGVPGGRASIDRNAGGSFTREFLFENSPVPFGKESTLAVWWEDMNGDRQLDLVRHGNLITENFTYSQKLTWLPMVQAAQAISTGTLVQNACGAGMDGMSGTFRLSDLDDDNDVDSWCFGGSFVMGEQLSSALNNGTGAFTETGRVSSPVPFGFEMTVTDAGDLNQDGVVDYITTNMPTGSPAWIDGVTGRVHEATKPALFATAPITFGAGNTYADIELADLEGDGKLEALLARGANLEIWQRGNAGVTEWSLQRTVAVPSAIQQIAVANVDGAVGIDVVLSTLQGVRLMTNDGAGRLTLSATVIGSGSLNDLAVGDLDEDGDRDLIVSSASGQKSLQPWFNNGQGSFTAGVAFGDNGSTHVRLADFDADGDLDAIVTTSSSKQVWKNNAKGVFGGATLLDTTPSVDLAVADLDGNDTSDLYILHPNSPADYVYLQPGIGSLQVSPQNTLSVALGDLDNDGDYDAVLGTELNQNSSVMLNGGTGKFNPTRDLLTKARSVAVSLGDADGDGDLDIFYANEGSVELFLNNNNPTNPRSDLLPPPPAPRFDDHGNTMADATQVAQPTDAQPLTITGKFDFTGDVDVFSIPVVPGERYRVRSNTGFFVKAASGFRVEGDFRSGYFIATDIGGPPINRVYLEVSLSVGTYELTIDPEPNDHGNNRDDATRIAVPSSTPGRIGIQEERDMMRFTAEPGKTYDIRLQTGPGIFASLRLFESAGASIADGVGTNKGFSRIVYKAVPSALGPYLYPEVTCFCANLDYTLVITEMGQGEEIPKGDIAGDANLDGFFNSLDLINLFVYGQFEDDEEDNSDWWTGDWDGDRDFTTQDLILAMQSGAYEKPEPAHPAALPASRVDIDTSASLREIGAALLDWDLEDGWDE